MASKDEDAENGRDDGVPTVTTVEAQSSRHPHHHAISSDHLSRRLSARQVQMIAIGGTIGTGLFLGTGKSLSTGGPASLLIAYAIVGGIVFTTMLALGEMAAFVPVAGSFCVFAGRFVDEAMGFALTWNYWANDAVSVASDLVSETGPCFVQVVELRGRTGKETEWEIGR